jgi:hypothetical protein
MQLVAIGLAGLAVSHVISEIDDAWKNNVSGPISKYLDDKATEATINHVEDERQIRVAKSRSRRESISQISKILVFT